MVLNVGIIGYGYWGPNLVRNFSETKDSRVIRVCDPRTDRLALAQARYPAIKTSLAADELIDDPEVDAVIIATPVSSHYGLAMQALRAGKHVLVEKPLTATADEASRLLEESDRVQRVLMVDHTFIYTGAVRKVKDLVETGQVGQLYYYDSVRINLGLFQHDVNVLWDLAVHDLSIMDYVLNNQPYAVSATGMAHIPGEPENVAYLTCFFEKNLIAHFHVNWLSPVKIRQTLIGGDHKMIVFDDLEPSEKIKVYDRGVKLNDNQEGIYKMLVSYRTGDMWAPHLDGTEALRTVALHFIDCIDHKKEPITDGKAGLRVVKILEAATHSLSEQGKLIKIQ